MAKLDYKVLLKEAWGEIKPDVRSALESAKDARDALAELEERVALTVTALENETDPATLEALRHNLEHVLPARRALVLSAATSKVAGDVQAALEVGLDFAIKVALMVAKSFVPIPTP